MTILQLSSPRHYDSLVQVQPNQPVKDDRRHHLYGWSLSRQSSSGGKLDCVGRGEVLQNQRLVEEETVIMQAPGNQLGIAPAVAAARVAVSGQSELKLQLASSKAPCSGVSLLFSLQLKLLQSTEQPHVKVQHPHHVKLIERSDAFAKMNAMFHR